MAFMLLCDKVMSDECNFGGGWVDQQPSSGRREWLAPTIYFHVEIKIFYDSVKSGIFVW